MSASLLDRVEAACRRMVMPSGVPEREIRDRAADALTEEGFMVGTEQTIGDRLRLDLVVAGESGEKVAVECKLGRPSTAIYAQLSRYAQSGILSGAVLLCERSISIDDEDGIGMPVRVVGWGRARGISL